MTKVIEQQYIGGATKFLAADTLVSDPAPGERKYLYMVWKSGTATYSAVIGENDAKGINLSPAPAGPSDILYAGYGVWNKTVDVTTALKQQYDHGTRTFTADNSYGGDPSPGDRKYLYAIWQIGGVQFSGVVGENDGRGFTLP